MPTPELSAGVLFLCEKRALTRERLGYYNAFAKCSQTSFLNGEPGRSDVSLSTASLAIHDGYHALPMGLEKARCMTCCLHIDTFDGLAHRLRMAGLFDYNFVFHPGYDSRFKTHGISHTGFLPHAVEGALFQDASPEKLYDVGWVGSLVLKEHASRRESLLRLKSRFVLNDIERQYSPEEMALVYKQSRIVVNFPRSDYPQDANLRCFEAMAAGALLITRGPTELASLGFVEGMHFVSYSEEGEIEDLVAHYLQQSGERNMIASAARDVVMAQHTYDARVSSMLLLMEQGGYKKDAPARSWNGFKVRRFYVWYFALQWRPARIWREVSKVGPLWSRAMLGLYATLLLLRFGLRRLRHLLTLMARRL